MPVLLKGIPQGGYGAVYKKTNLYISGNECADVTGGWIKVYKRQGIGGLAQKYSSSLYVQGAPGSTNAECGFGMVDFITVTRASILLANITRVKQSNFINYPPGIIAMVRYEGSAVLDGAEYVTYTGVGKTGVVSMDLTNIIGDVRVLLLGYADGGGIEANKVWLE